MGKIYFDFSFVWSVSVSKYGIVCKQDKYADISEVLVKQKLIPHKLLDLFCVLHFIVAALKFKVLAQYCQWHLVFFCLFAYCLLIPQAFLYIQEVYLSTFFFVAFSYLVVFDTIVLLLRYDAMIFEALSTLKATNGCDIGVIVHFIEVRWISAVMYFCACSHYDSIGFYWTGKPVLGKEPRQP